MKKVILCTFAAMLLSCTVLTACTSAPPADPDPTAGNAASEAIVQAVVDEAQAQIGSMEDLFGGMFTIEIEARGAAIAYTYTYTETFDDITAVRSGIEEALPAQEATFATIVSQLKDAGVENPSVIIEYFNGDGAEIYSTEIK